MVVITNNPMVRDSDLDESINLIWVEGYYEDVLITVRNWVHRGHKLLTHPLAGSVKPYETPYRTVLVTDEALSLHMESLKILEQAFALLSSFKQKGGRLDSLRTYQDEHLPDLQLVDYGLMEAAIKQQPTMQRELRERGETE
jgi:hypothetical protein